MRAKILQGIYATSEPNEEIDLYSGKLIMSWPNGSVEGDGTIKLEWSPEPRVHFHLVTNPEFRRVPPPSSNDDTLVLTSTNGKGTVSTFGEAFTGDPSKRIIEGQINQSFEVGNPAPVASILFHVPNFPDFLGKQVDIGNGVSASRMEIESAKWHLNLDGIPNVDIHRQLSEQGGFAITHVGEVRRQDDEPIQYSEVEELMVNLHWYFSMLRSERTGPILVAGIHEGETIWERWESGITSPWLGRRSWLPRFPPVGKLPADSDPTSVVFQYMCELVKDPTGPNSFEMIIDWYTQSVTNSNIATRGILAQAGIELLAWLELVEDVGMSADGFGRLTAADQLRLLLSSASIPIDVPPSLPKLYATTRKSSDGDEIDGPGAVTEIRNSMVHPKKKARFGDPIAMLEGSFLAARYLELSLLHRCGYAGRVMNRTNWSESASVPPWVKPETGVEDR